MIKGLERKGDENKLKSCCFFQPRGETWGESQCVYSSLKRESGGTAADLFGDSNRTQWRLKLDIRDTLLSKRGNGHWNRLPREAVTAPRSTWALPSHVRFGF